MFLWELCAKKDGRKRLHFLHLREGPTPVTTGFHPRDYGVRRQSRASRRDRLGSQAMKPKRMILAGKIVAAISGVCLLAAAYQNHYRFLAAPFFRVLDFGLLDHVGNELSGRSEVLWAALLIVGTMIALAGMILERLDQSPRPPGSPGQG